MKIFLLVILAVTVCSSAFCGHIEVWKKLAEQGDTDAQFKLGCAYFDGKDVSQNLEESVKWFRKAAEQGVHRAQTALGMIYFAGKGVAQDQKEGIRWWRKAAEQTNSHAMLYLGLAYSNGEGVPQDYVEAYFWLALAADVIPEAAELRDNEAKKLTSNQMVEMQERHRKWFVDNAERRISQEREASKLIENKTSNNSEKR